MGNTWMVKCSMWLWTSEMFFFFLIRKNWITDICCTYASQLTRLSTGVSPCEKAPGPYWDPSKCAKSSRGPVKVTKGHIPEGKSKKKKKKRRRRRRSYVALRNVTDCRSTRPPLERSSEEEEEDEVQSFDPECPMGILSPEVEPKNTRISETLPAAFSVISGFSGVKTHPCEACS